MQGSIDALTERIDRLLSDRDESRPLGRQRTNPGFDPSKGR
jgi:hypothetical protein